MKILKYIRDYFIITVASALFSVSISMFLNPNGIAPGGVSGIAVILNHTIGISTGMAILLMNLPLLIIGYFKIGRIFVFRTLYVTVLSSFMIDCIEKNLPQIVPVTDDLILASLAGGSIMAISMGILYRTESSTGGTDIVIKLLKKHLRSIRTGVIYLSIDSLIIIASAITFGGIELPMYSAIAVITSSVLLDRLLYGTDEAKLLFIISDSDTKIAKCLLKEANLGVTYFDGMGGYTGSNKKILFCAVKKHIYYKVKDIVKREDPKAFMIITNASEIYGKGYKRHGAEEL